MINMLKFEGKPKTVAEPEANLKRPPRRRLSDDRFIDQERAATQEKRMQEQLMNMMGVTDQAER